MGHQRLGTLPASRKWNAVVALFVGGASAASVAAATAEAAEGIFKGASSNKTLRHAFWLLTQIPLAARSANFGSALRALGLDVSDSPSLPEISTAMLTAIDRVDRSASEYSDMSEIASKAAVESLFSVASRAGDSLFGTTYAADEARAALRGLSTDRQFGVLARDFMARLTRSNLDYFLSRVLANHVGANRRLESIKDHHVFSEALMLHCREASLIVEQFACEWFSKANFEGGITLTKAGGFMRTALTKLRDELQIRRDSHA